MQKTSVTGLFYKAGLPSLFIFVSLQLDAILRRENNCSKNMIAVIQALFFILLLQ